MLKLFLPFKKMNFFSSSNLFSNLPFFKKNIVSWKHTKIDLNTKENQEIITLDSINSFLTSLDKNKNYILLICIISEQGMHMAPKSRIENVNYLSSPDTLFYKVNSEVSTILERYHINYVQSIVFRYREFVSNTIVLPPTKFPKSNVPVTQDIKNNIFSDFFGPFSLNYKNFGKIIEDLGDIKTFIFKDRFKIIREFKPINDTIFYHVQVLNKLNNDLITSYIDMKINSNHFIRTIDGYKLTIKNGIISMFESTGKFKFINALSPDFIMDQNMGDFITYDLECYLDHENKFVPYAAAWYKKGVCKTYYSLDFENPNEMIYQSFMDLLVKENKNCSVYIHNNKRFDSIFIINALLKSDLKITPLYKDELALSIAIVKDSGSKNPIRLTIKDSYLILPSSLERLCKDFGTETKKSMFPHSFACLNNLSYEGSLPNLEHFEEGIFNSPNEYTIFKENNTLWNFKDESLKYITLDVKSLYEVLFLARKLIYSHEGVDLTNVISNASLSFKIFRTKYLTQIPQNIKEGIFQYSSLEWKKLVLKFTPKIAILTKKEFNYMSKAYFGGITEVFKPYIKNGYYYDVNSLYPFVMLNLMPIGSPTYSTDSVLDNYFGIVKARIKTPRYLAYPVLPIKCEDGKNRSVLGTWIGTYCSEELKNARDNFGYKIEVIDGFKFDSGHIFKEFVEHFYHLKNENKGTALGTIFKLILNSLYGRFGMSPIITKTEILTQDQTEKILFNHQVLNIRDLGDGKELVTFEIAPRTDNKEMDIGDYINLKINSDNQETVFNNNVAISLFISSYARMYMYSTIKENDLKVYYMDTDSLVLDRPLPDEMVSKDEIGKFKLEYKIKEGVHAGLKTYFHKTNLDNKPLVIKAKGAGANLNFNDFEKLIKMETVIYPKEKWFIDRTNLTIEIKNIPLELKGGTNKRKMIVHNGVWVDTKPLNITEIPTNHTNIIISSQDYFPLIESAPLTVLTQFKVPETKPNYKLVDYFDIIDHFTDLAQMDKGLFNPFKTSINLYLISYLEPPKVIINFPSEFEIIRLYGINYYDNRSVITLNPDRSFDNFYTSINVCCKELNLTHRTIEKYANTGVLYKIDTFIQIDK